MLLFATKKAEIPQWFPVDVQEAVAGKSYTWEKLPAPVRRRLHTPENIPVAAHAEQFRRVTDGPHVGPWQHSFAPHTIKIMNTFGLSHVREVWFCGVDQSGKTNTMLNCMHWAIDVAPGDIFYAMPTQTSMEKVFSGKIVPMIRQSSRLKKYISKKENDVTQAGVKLTNGVTIFPSWANSASSLATFSAKYCFGDEVDKFPPQTGKEADPITLIKKRNRQYHGRYKRFFSSTPAQGFIRKGTMACSQVWEGRSLCPECGELVRLSGENLDWGDRKETPTAEDVKNGLVKVAVCCPSCGSVWTEPQRLAAIRAGHWVTIKDSGPRPTTVGFIHRCWDCLDISITEIAEGWCRAQHGDTVDKIAWANGFEADDYEMEQETRKEDFILRLVDNEQPKDVVPRDISYMMIVADTQQQSFFYHVLAFGWGKELPVAMISHGHIATFAELNNIAQQDFFDADGRAYRCQSGWIDSGGGTNPLRPKHSRTVEVYNFCRENRFWRPVKGQQRMSLPWDIKRRDFYPASEGKKVPIPGGLNLYLLNVTLFKDALSSKLENEPGSPGAITLHSDVTSGYARQLCAEWRDDRGLWFCKKGVDNHFGDTWVYGLAAADIIGIKTWKRGFQAEEPVTVISKGVQSI